MKTETMHKIISALKQLDRADHTKYWMLSEIAKFSGVPRATTYRYLKMMVKIELVLEFKRDYKKKQISEYIISHTGLGYVENLLL